MPDPLPQSCGQSRGNCGRHQPDCGPDAGLAVVAASIIAPAALRKSDQAATQTKQHGHGGRTAEAKTQQAKYQSGKGFARMVGHGRCCKKYQRSTA